MEGLGFYLTRVVDFVRGGGGVGWGREKSLKVLTVEVEVIPGMFVAIYVLKYVLNSISSEASEKKLLKNSV